MKRLLTTLGIGFAVILFALALMIQQKLPEREEGVFTAAQKNEIQKISVPAPDFEIPEQPGEEKFYYASNALSAKWIFDPDYKGGCLELFYEDGKLWIKMIFKNGQLQGETQRYYPDGQLWEKRMFEGGQEYGVQEFFYPDGSPWVRWFAVNGEVTDLPEVFSENSTAPAVLEKMNADQSKYFTAFSPENDVITHWSESDDRQKVISIVKSYFANSKISSEWGIAGDKKPHGFARMYDPLEKIWFETEFAEGVPQGKAHYFYADARPWSEIIFNDDGTRKATKFYYPSGSIWFVLNHDPAVMRYLPKIFSEAKATVTEVK